MRNAKGQPEAKPALTSLKGQILSRTAIVIIHQAPRYSGFKAIFVGPASSAQLGFRFACRRAAQSPRYAIKGNGSPDGPHDAPDAGFSYRRWGARTGFMMLTMLGSWGLLGSKCAENALAVIKK